jgi:hypothetical protein
MNENQILTQLRRFHLGERIGDVIIRCLRDNPQSSGGLYLIKILRKQFQNLLLALGQTFPFNPGHSAPALCSAQLLA